LPEERTAFDTGPALAMCESEMKITRQLDDLARNRRLEGISPDMLSGESHRLYLDQPLVIISVAAMQIGRPEESL
jgi:hypothetical protein